MCDILFGFFFFFNDTATTEIYTLSLHDALPILQKLIHDVHDLSNLHKEKCPTCGSGLVVKSGRFGPFIACARYPECRFTKPLRRDKVPDRPRSEEHTSELQSQSNLVCRLLLEKKKKKRILRLTAPVC